jgi:ankyrin repeat protein
VVVGQVRLLLKHGADPNKEERKQRLAPIHIAADKGHVEVQETKTELIKTGGCHAVVG